MYVIRPPAPALSRFIESYWLVAPTDGTPVDLRVDVFVDGRADLIFNFGAPYVREVLGGAAVEHHDSNVDAQRLTPIRITQRGMVRISGVRFRLGGLGAFVRVPLGELTNRTPPPSEVFGDDVLALERALRDELDGDAHAALYDQFFLARLSHDDACERLHGALDRLVASGGNASVDELAAHAGITARHLERLFARFVGLPPKTVARIVRFQTALRALMRDPGSSLAEVAMAAGYFDQSHFVREFKRMSGGVPRGYRGYYPAEGPSDFAPNVVVFVDE